MTQAQTHYDTSRYTSEFYERLHVRERKTARMQKRWFIEGDKQFLTHLAKARAKNRQCSDNGRQNTEVRWKNLGEHA